MILRYENYTMIIKILVLKGINIQIKGVEQNPETDTCKYC